MKVSTSRPDSAGGELIKSEKSASLRLGEELDEEAQEDDTELSKEELELSVDGD